jgi:hypothetical protein
MPDMFLEPESNLMPQADSYDTRTNTCATGIDSYPNIVLIIIIIIIAIGSLRQRSIAEAASRA